MDRVSAGPVSCSHITVALGDSTSNTQVTVLAVHVVYTGTGLVTQPDTEILDFNGALLCDFLYQKFKQCKPKRSIKKSLRQG